MTRSIPALMMTAVAGVGLAVASTTSAQLEQQQAAPQDAQEKETETFEGEIIDLHAYLTEDEDARQEEDAQNPEADDMGAPQQDEFGAQPGPADPWQDAQVQADANGPLGLKVEDPGVLDRITGAERYKAYILLFDDADAERAARDLVGQQATVEGIEHDRDGLKAVKATRVEAAVDEQIEDEADEVEDQRDDEDDPLGY